MAKRIENYAELPATLPVAFEGELKSERVQDLPVSFNNSLPDRATLDAANRLLLNLKAVKTDLQILKLAGFFTIDDYRQLITVADTELVTLNSMLGAEPSVMAQLADLTSRVVALETP
jgi:hypothetical protein